MKYKIKTAGNKKPVVTTSYDVGRKMLLRTVEKALKAADYTVLDADGNSITVKNNGKGPDFEIQIHKLKE